MKQLFQVTERLMKGQTEIGGLATVDYKETNVGDRRVFSVTKLFETTNAKTHVFADSVLFLGSMRDQPVEAW